MANECIFCHERHIPTNTIVLNEGAFWCEFCATCGENHVLHNDKGEAWLVRDLFESGQPNYVRKQEDIDRAKMLADSEFDAWKNDSYYEDDADYYARMEEYDRETRQLADDAFANTVDRQLHSARFKPHADALRLYAA